jgi:hypothetical protein
MLDPGSRSLSPLKTTAARRSRQSSLDDVARGIYSARPDVRSRRLGWNLYFSILPRSSDVTSSISSKIYVCRLVFIGILRFYRQSVVMSLYLNKWKYDKYGVSAVEFALVAPMIILLLFGLFCFGTVETIYIATQQLVAEAARASVAGLSDSERSQIVQSFVTSNVGSYAFLDPTKITVTSATISNNPSTYQVNLTYDMSGSFIYEFSALLPLPSSQVQRSAVVLNGGS